MLSATNQWWYFAFLVMSCFLCVCFFLKKIVKSFRNTSRDSVWIQIRLDDILVLVQAVCKDYQQRTKVTELWINQDMVWACPKS